MLEEIPMNERALVEGVKQEVEERKKQMLDVANSYQDWG